MSRMLVVLAAVGGLVVANGVTAAKVNIAKAGSYAFDFCAASGTGKYDGMVLKGEYRIDNNWGSPAKEVAFLGCNPNKGSYKLK